MCVCVYVCVCVCVCVYSRLIFIAIFSCFLAGGLHSLLNFLRLHLEKGPSAVFTSGNF